MLGTDLGESAAAEPAESAEPAELAELAGVPQGQVRGIECAVGVNPTQKTLLKLAWALDADLCIVPRDAATS
jgi:transcriptional regulator with XRE-family HTH domain